MDQTTLFSITKDKVGNLTLNRHTPAGEIVPIAKAASDEKGVPQFVTIARRLRSYLGILTD